MNESNGTKGDAQLVGRYANFFQVGHTAFEFVIDFGQSYQNETAERLHTRIVTSPAYAAELLRLLGASVEQYESTFGMIRKNVGQKE